MADYYGNIVDADAYHSARGNAGTWDAVDVDDSEKQIALLLASEWIDQNYASQFSGEKTGKRTQLREWPRTNAVDYYGDVIGSSVTPTEIQQATYEVALQQIKQAGSLFKSWTAGTAIKQVSVDGAISLTYNGATSFADVQIIIPKITGILAPILTGEGYSSVAGKTSRI